MALRGALARALRTELTDEAGEALTAFMDELTDE